MMIETYSSQNYHFIMSKRHSVRTSFILIVIFLAAAGMLLFAARRFPGFAQWYSVTIYPALVGSIGRLSGVISWSVAELLCFLLPALIIIDLVLSGIRKHLGGALIRFLLLASILFFLYAACCGVNYYREPFVSQEMIESAEISQVDLVEFCEYTASELNECYKNPESDNEFSVPEYPEGDLLRDEAVTAILSIGDTRLIGYYPSPKILRFLSGFFSSMGVSGIYSPFTIEANINGDMPGMEMPFTACHELSHLRGFMNEGEANYIGWLACINSDNKSFNRSGWLIAWSYAGAALRRTDPGKFAEIYEKLPSEAIRELTENNEFWRSHKTKASDVQDKVNDAYLKSNGQDQGIESYGQLTTLMLTWFKTKGL